MSSLPHQARVALLMFCVITSAYGSFVGKRNGDSSLTIIGKQRIFVDFTSIIHFIIHLIFLLDNFLDSSDFFSNLEATEADEQATSESFPTIATPSSETTDEPQEQC